eukprot:RCo005958
MGVYDRGPGPRGTIFLLNFFLVMGLVLGSLHHRDLTSTHFLPRSGLARGTEHRRRRRRHFPRSSREIGVRWLGLLLRWPTRSSLQNQRRGLPHRRGAAATKRKQRLILRGEVGPGGNTGLPNGELGLPSLIEALVRRGCISGEEEEATCGNPSVAAVDSGEMIMEATVPARALGVRTAALRLEDWRAVERWVGLAGSAAVTFADALASTVELDAPWKEAPASGSGGTAGAASASPVSGTVSPAAVISK